MRDPRDDFQAYPRELKASTADSDQVCRREELYFAVQELLEEQNDLFVEWRSSGDRITVFRGHPDKLDPAPDRRRLRPVYRLLPDGPLLVPTGLVFVRFKEGVPAEDRRRQIAEAGFAVDSIPPYAPHGAWLKPADGEVSSALSGIGALEALPDMVNVEPQLLGPRAQR